MGILSRAKTILESNINAALDACEDPAKMIDQSLLDLAKNLAKVHESTAGVIAEEKRAKRALDENAAEISKFDQLARKALSNGKEHDARVFLGKKKVFEEKGIELEKIHSAASKNAQKMKQIHDQLVDEIEALKSKREMIKAKVAVAKTQDMVGNLAVSSIGSENAKSVYERMEDKADRMLDKADAMIEINEDRLDDAELLAREYTIDQNGAAVDDALAQLKKEMGL